ncbi:MAG: tRNA (5-methylaminomethyl-2-thiouridylate)-methyltransferase [Gammaproteobacteria bacterium]|jgi:tRNA U34 2-thiouridine synthase MnmA/TrmU
MINNKKIKAVALISGGLDSLLATKVILEQGIYVEGLNFYSGFFGVGSRVVTLNNKQNKPNYNNAQWVADQLGIKLHVVDVVEKFKDVFLNPKYGYGSQLNPCIDCKIFIVQQALVWMKENDFDFIISGEVIGQRPMSQRRDAMNVVKRDSGAKGLLLRPLCAKYFPETIPEKEGWVDRSKLLDFVGRDRKPHIALAKSYGFKNFPQPGGGCLLTEANFCARIKDMWHDKDSKDYTLDEINLLKVGRHLRPRSHFKLIIGRFDAENKFLEKYQDKYISLRCVDRSGPLVLIDGEANEDDLNLAAKITAKFSKCNNAEDVLVQINNFQNHTCQVKVKPLIAQEILPEWYV